MSTRRQNDARVSEGHNFWFSGPIGLKIYKELRLQEVIAMLI